MTMTMTMTTESQIFNRWGTRVTITGYCGKHKPKWSNAELILLRVTYHDDDGTTRTGYQYATNLKADGGWATIDAAVQSAPEVTLDKAERNVALHDAD